MACALLVWDRLAKYVLGPLQGVDRINALFGNPIKYRQVIKHSSTAASTPCWREKGRHLAQHCDATQRRLTTVRCPGDTRLIRRKVRLSGYTPDAVERYGLMPPADGHFADGLETKV
jgi:hypothetical protein